MSDQPFSELIPEGAIGFPVTPFHTDYALNLEGFKNNLEKSHNKILGIGLRNPWQFFETGGFFVIPDVGFSVNEEINITKIDKANK